VSDDADKKFFQCEDGDGGATYSVVARDLEHALKILRDADVHFDSDYGRPADLGAGSLLIWTEIDAERAAQISIYDESQPTVVRNLAQFAIGDWFCSEY
jgi:hypothetical protein